jgi:predicted porin
MKKTIIASAIAAVVAAPVAFADVKISGQITTEIKSIDNAGDIDMEEDADLFISGSEDLGNGMKAFFKMGTSPDQAGASFAEDDRFVGISADFGTITLGRFEELSSAKVQDMANGLASSEVLTVENKPTSTGRRGDKGVRYESPNFNGVSIAVEGFMDGDEFNTNTNADDFNSTTTMIQYSNAGLTVRVANENNDNANTDSTSIGVSYTMGDITVAVTDTNSKIANQDVTVVGAKYAMGANSVAAAFVTSSGDTTEEGDFIVKATHSLSKSTSAWVGYQNDDNGNDTTVVGLKHAF